MSKPVYLFDVVGAIGDSLCTEPVLRYAIRNLPDEDIRILTNLPHLFQHLNKPMGSTWEELGLEFGDPTVKHIFNRLELIIDGQHVMHPIVRYITPHLTDPIDFISMLMMKRTMPDADKKIHLEFKDTTEKVESIVGGCLEDLTLVHVGTGAPEKTRLFPEEYCNHLIDELIGRGLKVAVIATTDHRSHATPIKNQSVINLVDKLKWDDFCTIISKAKILITNDSSPVHLASIFDNWIIALPTVKHPDRLIHPRNGHRYHKAMALYKRLMCDDSTEIKIDQIVSKFNWDGIDNFRDKYLADPVVIARHARQIATGLRDLIGGINPLNGG
jgi:hypothetical protein